MDVTDTISSSENSTDISEQQNLTVDDDSKILDLIADKTSSDETFTNLTSLKEELKTYDGASTNKTSLGASSDASDEHTIMAVDAGPSMSMSHLKEHPDWDNVLSQIPTKIQQGFRNINVIISCLDVEESHLLFGSNAGCGFLYNRETGGFIKLLSESRSDIITAVKLFVGIECQSALGTEDGKITIVIFSYGAANASRQVQKFSLGKVHQSEVTCMEWSSNGMKLYTGDKNGNVYLVERDFEKNKCNISLILTEKHEIVDLSYKHMILLVSTTERTIPFHTNKKEDNLKPVGSKPTRQGCFGACFNPGSVSASDLQVFCTRPGYRIWIANTEGQVTNTLVLKDLVSSPHPEICLETTSDQTHKDLQFRKLMFFQDKYLLTYSETSIFLIDHTKPCIVASNQNLVNILGVAMTTDAIYILCKDRELHRISENPDEIMARRKRLQEEEKKKDGQSLNLHDVKESLSEMKKNLTPLVGVLQSRMSSLNEGAGQWSQKIQSQAKELQKKLPGVATSFFTREEKNVATSPEGEHERQVGPTHSDTSADSKNSDDENEKLDAEIRSSEPQDPNLTKENVPNNEENESNNGKSPATNTDCNILSCYDSTTPLLDADVFKGLKSYDEKTCFGLKISDHDFLHSQGHPELLNTSDEVKDQPSLPPVKFHFEKLDEIVPEDGGEIVFVSKRKKKSRSASGSSGKHSASPLDITNTSNSPRHQSVEDHSMLTSDLHSSRTEINSELPVPGLKVEGESSSTNAESNNLLVIDDDLQEVEVGSSQLKGELLATVCCHEDVESSQFKGESSTPEENQKLIVVMHKTNGNQLCPKIVESPKIDATDFEFSSPKIVAPKLSKIEEDKTNYVKNADFGVISPSQLNDSGVSLTAGLSPGSGISVIANHPVKLPISSTTPLEIHGDFGIGLGSNISPQSRTPTECAPGTLFVKTTLLPATQKFSQKPLFSDSEESGTEGTSKGPEKRSEVHIASSPDDIYGVDMGTADFGSEIETESECSEDDEVQVRSSSALVQKQVSVASSTHSFTSGFADFSTSVPVKLLDSWSMSNFQQQVISMSGSDNYVWYIDNYNHVYIAEETGLGMCNVKWKKLAKKGVQLCISPSGEDLMSNSRNMLGMSGM